MTDWVKTRILEPLQQPSAWKSVLFTPVSLVPLPRNDDFLMAEKVMVSAARSGNGLDVLVRQTRRADPLTSQSAKQILNNTTWMYFFKKIPIHSKRD